MKILVLNCGSSSIKYKLFDMDSKEVIAQGGIEKIGLKGSFLKFTLPNGEKKILEKDIPEHTVGVEFILHTLTDPEYGAIKSLDEINAVGHRMVHGGERFSKSVLLDKEVLEAFTACNDLAPLHNPANLKGVDAISAILPNIPQVGVFDTAFHQTMPDYAYLYAVPYELYEKYGVRRYGFHGTSHRYVSQRVCEYLGVKPEGLKLIADWALLAGVIVFFILHADWWYDISQSSPDYISWVGVGAAMVSMMTSFVTSYARARAESVGFEVKNGIATRADRLVIILVGMAITGLTHHGLWLAIDMVLLAVLGVVTEFQRVLEARRQMAAGHRTYQL